MSGFCKVRIFNALPQRRQTPPRFRFC
jgi:hypothetical protein